MKTPCLIQKSLLLFLATFVLIGHHAVWSQTIKHVETFPNTYNSLLGVSDVSVSLGGKFVYAASYQSSSVSIFSRDLLTGKLSYISKVSNISASF